MVTLPRFLHSRAFLAPFIVLCGLLPCGAFASNDNVIDPGAPPPRAPHLRYQIAPDFGGPYAKLSAPVDVVFAIDNTGSMGGVIDTLKNDAVTIAAKIREQFPNTAFGAIKFKDYGYDSAYVTEIATPITLDIDMFNAGIAEMGIHGGAGGDYPEAYVETVLQGVQEMKWRHDTLRLLVVVGDAPPHDPLYDTGVSGSGHTWAEAAEAASNAGVVVSMVAVGYGLEDLVVYTSYNYMTSATGGVYVESSQPEEVTNALITLILSLSHREPQVVSVRPANNASNVSVEPVIQVEFNMDMDITSFTAGTVCMDAGAYCVPTQLYYDPWNRALQVTPLLPLEKGHKYAITLGNGLRSFYEDELSTYKWGFTTVTETPVKQVRSNIEAFVEACKFGLDSQKCVAADLVSQAATGLGRDEVSTSARDLVNLAIDWRSSGIVRALDFNHANGLSGELATLIASTRQIEDMPDEEKTRLLQKAEHHASQMLTWSDGLDDSEALKSRLENDLVLLDDNNHSHTGVQYFREVLEARTNSALAAVQDTITAKQAAAVATFLCEQRAMAARAATQETMARWSHWDGVCRVDSVRPLGHMTSYQGELETAIAYFSVKDAKATATITKATGPVLKAGGLGAFFAGTGAPAGVGSFALGEKLYWGSTVEDWMWDTATPESRLRNIALSPRDCMKHVLFESIDSLEDEGWLWVDFVNSTLDEVDRILSPAKAGGAEDSFAKAIAVPVQIVSLAAPNINPADIASVSTLTVRNNGSNPVRCTATGVVYGLSPSGGEQFLVSVVGSRESLDVSAGATGKFTLSVPGFPLALSGLPGCLLTMTVSATDTVTGNTWLVGPASTTFYMVTPEEASLISSTQTRTILSGEVTPGDRQEQTFTLPSGISTALLTLFTTGANLADLHLFNAASDHTGLNYLTETREKNIPNSSYLASAAEIETITLTRPVAEDYVARVVGQEGPAKFNVQLTTTTLSKPVPAVMTPITASAVSGTTAGATIFIREAGGRANITNLVLGLPDELKDPRGRTISKDMLKLGVYSAVVPMGGTVAVPLSITVPEGTIPGSYTGALQFSAAGMQKSIPIELKVGISMPSFTGMTCLAAQAALARAGLVAGPVLVVYDPSARVGTIVGQNPPPGAGVAPGTQVILIITTDKKIDVDCSGMMDARDVQLVINAALGRNIGVLCADLNSDAMINAKDVQLVTNAVLGKF